MKKLIVLLLFAIVLFATPAFSKWVKISDDNGGTYKNVVVIERITINFLTVEINRVQRIFKWGKRKEKLYKHGTV